MKHLMITFLYRPLVKFAMTFQASKPIGIMLVLVLLSASTATGLHEAYGTLSTSAGFGTNLQGATTLYTFKINPTVNSNIAHIQVTLPSGFTFPTPRVFNVQNIGPGHISTPSALTLSYDVTTPVTISSGTQIVLIIGGIVNTNTLGSGQQVTFTTLDSSNAVIETGTFPLNIVTGASGPQGATGAHGAAGINGANGHTGAAGTNGAKGKTGAAGTNGAKGPKGTRLTKGQNLPSRKPATA
jgi:hypothetical protein